jgi:hypothetical protein
VVTLADAATDTGSSWVAWVLGGLAAWVVVGFLAAVLIGKSIQLADRRSAIGDPAKPLTLEAFEAAAGTRTAPVRRRTVPIPPIGVALFAVAVALETCGYVVRLTGASGPTAQLLSMDAPFSVPRLYIAALFAAAALAAVAGAGSLPGRRPWWTAVALVAGVIAAVKAGSTVHAQALGWLVEVLGAAGAFLVSVSVALTVVAALWFLSRTEQRDRRRVLSALACYAGASVGLSALSSVSPGGNWAAAATFIEESGEALAGVGFLIAVLVGVAPRVVLPASWALRREADAHTLELPEALPGRSPGEGTART